LATFLRPSFVVLCGGRIVTPSMRSR
jgi:hypothetical protein